jgi:peptide chain release factor 2
MGSPSFWDDQVNAKKTIDALGELKLWTVPYQEISSRFHDVRDLLIEADLLNDPAFMQELTFALVEIEKKLEELEMRRMLSGPLDAKSCYVEINAGAGGTESYDWAAMVSRMYQRYAARRGWTVEIVDRLEGEVAGIKHMTFKFIGPFAYGYCKSEKGVHRLVRISPFDANAKRHTSFVSVDVTPLMEDVEVKILPEDLKIDTYRASGAGGQHVNKTDSAVRITHLPTNIERDVQLSALGGEKKEIAWGNQIRNYVLQPYRLIKDTRTGYEVGDVEPVLNGALEGFVEAYLKEFG